MRQLNVIDKCEGNKNYRRCNRSGNYVGRTPAETGVRSVGDGAEKRQHEKGKYVVKRHYSAAPRLGKAKFIGENLRDDAVVSLPESAYKKKDEANVNCLFVVKFHVFRPLPYVIFPHC